MARRWAVVFVVIAAAGAGLLVTLRGGAAVLHAHEVILPQIPKDVAVSPDGDQAYVLRGGNVDVDALSEIDLRTVRVVKTVDVGQDPSSISVGADGKYLYAGTDPPELADPELYVLRASNLSVVSTIQLHQQANLTATDPANPGLLLVDDAGGGVLTVNLVSGKVVQSVQASDTAESLAVSADGRWAYVGAGAGQLHGPNADHAELQSLDLRTGALVSTVYGPNASVCGLQLGNDGLDVVESFCAGPSLSGLSVLVLSTKTHRRHGDIGMPYGGAGGIAVGPGGAVYVAVPGGNRIFILGTTLTSIARTVRVSAPGGGIVLNQLISSANGRVLCATTLSYPDGRAVLLVLHPR